MHHHSFPILVPTEAIHGNRLAIYSSLTPRGGPFTYITYTQFAHARSLFVLRRQGFG